MLLSEISIEDKALLRNKLKNYSATDTYIGDLDGDTFSFLESIFEKHKEDLICEEFEFDENLLYVSINDSLNQRRKTDIIKKYLKDFIKNFDGDDLHVDLNSNNLMRGHFYFIKESQNNIFWSEIDNTNISRRLDKIKDLFMSDLVLDFGNQEI